MDLIELHDPGAVRPVAVFLQDGPLSQETCALGVDTVVLRAPRLRHVLEAGAFARRLAAALRSLEVDLVHSVMAWGHVHGGRAARRARLPEVWFQHNLSTPRSAVELAAAIVPSRLIFANSRHAAERQRRLNLRRTPIEIVPPGTRLPNSPRAVCRERGRAIAGVAPDAFVVGMTARLVTGKGHETFLRAAASLLRARADATLLIAGGPVFGDAHYPDRLRQLAAELGIAARVRWLGADVPFAEVLSACDVAVHLPEVPQSFGLGAIEAMAAGAALVASDCLPIREIVTPSVDALLVPPREPEILATTLLALHDDRATAARLAAAGADTAARRFDAVAMTRRVEATYRRVLAA
jgi:glycosyltransferase involved in cell wall biosynthesis